MDSSTANKPARSLPVRKKVGYGLAILLAAACIDGHATAASARPNLSVAPSIKQIDLSQPGAKTSYDITVRNLSGQSLALVASSLDIAGQSQDGSTVFTTPGKDTNHDIGSSLIYSPSQFTLAAGASQTVTVTIADINALEPGGHYGAAVFTTAGDSDNSAETVGVREAVSSLLFVTTASGGIRTIGTPTLTLPRFSWRLPTTTSIVFENSGNTQVAPQGSLQITRHGRLVANGIVNPESNLILVGQNRLFTVPLRYFGGLQLAGRYQAELTATAYQNGPQTRQKTEIIYVNPWFGAGAVAVIGGLVLLGIKLRRKRIA